MSKAKRIFLVSRLDHRFVACLLGWEIHVTMKYLIGNEEFRDILQIKCRKISSLMFLFPKIFHKYYPKLKIQKVCGEQYLVTLGP